MVIAAASCTLSRTLVLIGGLVLIGIAAWVGAFTPFWGRKWRERGQTYDRRRASTIPGAVIIAAIIAVLGGFWYGC